MRPPLFLIPGASSTGRRAFCALSGALGDDWPVCVLSDPSKGGKPYSIEDVARRFLPRIREIQPEGPYVVGGYCFGVVVAYEVARRRMRGPAARDRRGSPAGIPQPLPSRTRPPRAPSFTWPGRFE